jgi:hypothetical protein
MPSWKIGQLLRAKSIEEVSLAWSRRSSPIEEVAIDIQGFRVSLPLADSRLLGLLVHLDRLGAKVRLEVPVTGSSSRIPTGSALPNLFTQEVAGIALLSYSSSVATRHGADLRAELMELLDVTMRESQGQVTSPDRMTFLVQDSHPRFGPPDSISHVIEGKRDAFDLNLITRLIKHFNLPGLDTEHNIALNDFVWETLRNTQDHGNIGVQPPRAGLRYLDIRKFERRDLERSGAKLGITDYLTSIGEIYPRAPLIEITIADSGPGIAATMARGYSIYTGPPEIERERVIHAFTRSGSSKSNDDPHAGYGLRRALDVCTTLQGLLFVRTGRFEFTKNHFSQEPPERLEESSARLLPRTGGTSVSLIIPWAGSLPPQLVQI